VHTAKKRSLLQIPQGTEGFYLEEAYHHRQIVSRLENLFYSWGYLPVQTPVFDFFDIYRSIIPEDQTRNIYRLIDRDGDLLMLRSDITLFLAKQVGLLLKQEDLPLRVYYADTILRHQNREDISKNEFFQIGTELIGTPGERGDLEILYLLEKTLSATGTSHWVTHVGSRAFFSDITRTMNETEKESLQKTVLMRQTKEMEDILSRTVSDTGRRRTIRDLLCFIGTAAELRSALNVDNASRYLELEEKTNLEYVMQIVTQLEELLPDHVIRIDLSEIGTHAYYTGIVFQVYVDGIESAVASGGRYDTLLGRFGCDAPSVGFSILLRKLQDTTRSRSSEPEPGALHRVTEHSFKKAVREAELIRNAGGIAVL
jgi:ATP phosphoribosyltransferase regulatory subunit